MKTVNKIELSGSVCGVKGDVKHMYISLAVTRGKNADFHVIIVKGKLARTVLQYLKKGSKIVVFGSIQNSPISTYSSKITTQILAKDINLISQ